MVLEFVSDALSVAARAEGRPLGGAQLGLEREELRLPYLGVQGFTGFKEFRV